MNASDCVIRNYTANQLDENHFDELQRAILAYKLGIGLALDGPPGSGKTECILALQKILKKEFKQFACGRETSDLQLICRTSLQEKNGATVSELTNGVVTRAASDGLPVYLDEFNLLRPDRQKKLNSLFDDRKEITRPDGVKVKARQGFWSVISYNPGLSGRQGTPDLEDSVADRFVHDSFEVIPASISSLVNLKTALKKGLFQNGDTQEIHNHCNQSLHIRGIYFDGEGLPGFFFKDRKQDEFYDFFTGNLIANLGELLDSGNLFLYQVFQSFSGQGRVWQAEDESGFEDMNSLQVSTRLADFCQLLTNLHQEGARKDNLAGSSVKTEFSPVAMHAPTLRIQNASLRLFDLLCAMKCPKSAALRTAGFLLINQVSYGAYKNSKVADTNLRDFIMNIACDFGFFEAKKVAAMGDFAKMKKKLVNLVAS